ncbi:hypothetical protein [Biformimicrobium ophioploci]|uniref:Uncharacterized protein n=1 Tax=Biformimicrobium ophioploci TaxID=3036711 RepID=A0ABQ6LXH0_9GAMM|nr:hypothetical protein [Microbulbifer sp. NKW57]GMG86731.1 hypothetical protein MNKW57_10520 [Microbulbifer sp. NKW57]
MLLSTSSSEGIQTRILPKASLVAPLLLAIGVCSALLIAWEMFWRSEGAVPSYRNSDELWSKERRRINEGDGHLPVIAGSSRVLFNIDLDTWERLTGERPIQLGLEGTSPVSMVEGLANDPDFTGDLLIGVSPVPLFGGLDTRGKAVMGYKRTSYSARAGQWLSELLEPYLAFYHKDYALFQIIKRQPLPNRDGVSIRMGVRRLTVMDQDRNTRLWWRVESDPEYRDLARSIWAQRFPRDGKLPPPVVEFMTSKIENSLERMQKAVNTLHQRGVKVTFLQSPASGGFLELEQLLYPRESTWQILLAETGSEGFHWEDHPGLQGYELPEYSHIASGERERFTTEVLRLMGKIPQVKTAAGE